MQAGITSQAQVFKIFAVAMRRMEATFRKNELTRELATAYRTSKRSSKSGLCLTLRHCGCQVQSERQRRSLWVNRQGAQDTEGEDFTAQGPSMKSWVAAKVKVSGNGKCRCKHREVQLHSGLQPLAGLWLLLWALMAR